MWKLVRSSLIAIIVACVLVVPPAAAVGTTRWVDDAALGREGPGTSCAAPGYPTIQAAVSASTTGDVIKVCPGVYTENVVVPTADLTIRSVAGPLVTTVQAASSFYVFQVVATGLTLKGFTILPAGVADGDIAVNAALEGDTGLTIAGNIIRRGRIGVNLGCVSSASTVAFNVLTGQPEAGINIDTCEAPPFPGSHDNLIHHNVACSVTSTASIALGGSSNDNLIRHNIATTISVFGSGNDVHHNLTQVAIVDNGSGNTLTNNVANPAVCQ